MTPLFVRHGDSRLAIFHLTVSTISRSAGRSATAAAAYRHGVQIEDQRTGQVHDYTKRTGVVHSEIVLPGDAPEWASDRSSLWNGAEAAEARCNSVVAREVVVALPSELDEAGRKALAMDFAKDLAERHRCAVDVAIHLPGREGDERNLHAHMMMTTRRLDREGFGEKTRELDVRQSGAVEKMREVWAEKQNQALERAGIPERVDHRSFERQGVDKIPGVHLGPNVVHEEAAALREAGIRRKPGKGVVETATQTEGYKPVTDAGREQGARDSANAARRRYYGRQMAEKRQLAGEPPKRADWPSRDQHRRPNLSSPAPAQAPSAASPPSVGPLASSPAKGTVGAASMPKPAPQGASITTANPFTALALAAVKAAIKETEVSPTVTPPETRRMSDDRDRSRSMSRDGPEIDM